MFLPSLNIIRQSLAFSIVFLGIPALFKNRYWLFILLVVIASTVHIVAAISLVMLAAHIICTWSLKSKTTKRMILFLATILIAEGIMFYHFYLSDKISERLKNYFANMSFTFGAFGFVQLAFCFSLFAFAFIDSNEKYYNNTLTLAFLSLFSAAGTILGYFFKFVNRIFSNVAIFQFATYSTLWKKENNEYLYVKKPYALFKILALVLTIYPFISVLINDGYGVMHYGMFFW